MMGLITSVQAQFPTQVPSILVPKHERTDVSVDVREDGSAHIRVESRFPADDIKSTDITLTTTEKDGITKITGSGYMDLRGAEVVEKLPQYARFSLEATETYSSMDLVAKGPKVEEFTTKVGTLDFEARSQQENETTEISVSGDADLVGLKSRKGLEKLPQYIELSLEATETSLTLKKLKVVGLIVEQITSKMGELDSDIRIQQKGNDIEFTSYINIKPLPYQYVFYLSMKKDLPLDNLELMELMINQQLSKMAAQQRIQPPTIEIGKLDISINENVTIDAVITVKNWREYYIQLIETSQERAIEQNPQLAEFYETIQIQKTLSEMDIGTIDLSIQAIGNTMTISGSWTNFETLWVEGYPQLENATLDLTWSDSDLRVSGTAIFENFWGGFSRSYMEAYRRQIPEGKYPSLAKLYEKLWTEERIQAYNEADWGTIDLNIDIIGDTASIELDQTGAEPVDKGLPKQENANLVVTWDNNVLQIDGSAAFENFWASIGALAEIYGLPRWQVENIDFHLKKEKYEDVGTIALEMDIANYLELTETGRRLTLPERPVENIRMNVSLPGQENFWQENYVATSPTQMVTIDNLRAGQESIFEFTIEEQPIINVKVTSPKNIVNSGIAAAVIKAAKGVPKPPQGRVYKYQRLTPNFPSENLEKVEINFSVQMEWIKAQKANKEDVLMLQLRENNWNELPTTFIEEKAGLAYYSAETTSLSVLAITVTPAPEKPLPWALIAGAVGVVTAILVLAGYGLRKRAP